MKVLSRLSVWLCRNRLIREHADAIEAYESAKQRGDTRGQRYAFDRLRAATNARLEAGV